MTVAAALLACRASAEQAQERRVVFSPATTPEARTFIETWLPRLSSLGTEEWASRLDQGQVRWAEIDIDRDGTPERFVMATTPQDCDQYGCQTYVARFSTGRWWLVDAEHMPEADVGIPEARRGHYHSLRRGSFTTLFTLEEGKDVTFRPLANDAERAFARDWLSRNAKDHEAPAFWRKAVDENRIRIATADLNDDGVVERLLMVADPAWCGTAGCSTFILKHERGGWTCPTETNMHETVRVLDEKRNGWHRLIAGTAVQTFDKHGRVLESVDLATGEVVR